MPIEDAQRWNQRYQAEVKNALVNHRQFLLDNAKFFPNNGVILDVAMGLGKNAGFLLSSGFQVIGVDISFAGVSIAKEHFPEIQALVADLNHWIFPENYFDGIINFYYLQRDLFPKFKYILKSGGILIAETLMKDSIKVKPELNPEHLLDHGELLSLCQDLEILEYREGLVKSRRGLELSIASIIARKG